MESIAREIVAPLAERFDEYMKSSEENRRVLTALVTRLTTVVAGDKEFRQRGLVDTVDDHTVAIAELKSLVAEAQNQQIAAKAEIKGAVRATMVIGGVIITVVQLFIQIYFARG